MNSKLLITVIAGILGVVVIGFLFGVGMKTAPPVGGAQSGYFATIATSSQGQASSVAQVLVATSTRCYSRIITTGSGSNMMLIFSDRTGEIPTATVGHYQGASTTVTYDAGLYGCGQIRVFTGGTGVYRVAETQ